MQDKLQKTTDITYTFDSQHFSEVLTYIAIRENHRVVRIWNEDVESLQTKTVNWELCIPRQVFDERMRHGCLSKWVLEFDQQRAYKAISDEYLRAYRLGEWHTYLNSRDNVKPALELLEQGRFDLFVSDRTYYNGLMYDLAGKPITRHMPCDYITTSLTSKHYHCKTAADYLRQRADCRNVTLTDVPGYNSECPGERMVEFVYMPTDEDFQLIWSIDDSFDRTKEVLKLLGLQHFKKHYGQTPR